MTTPTIETLNWHRVEDQLPDAEITVLFYAPDYGSPVWAGWFDGEQWYHDGGGKLPKPVTHWAEFPLGPIESRNTTAHTRQAMTV